MAEQHYERRSTRRTDSGRIVLNCVFGAIELIIKAQKEMRGMEGETDELHDDLSDIGRDLQHIAGELARIRRKSRPGDYVGTVTTTLD